MKHDADGNLDLMDVIKRRFDFEAWRSRSTLAESLFILNMNLRGDEVPGMEMQRIRRVEPGAIAGVPADLAAAVDTRGGDRPAATAPRVHIQSIWRDALQPAVLVRLDIFECVSQADARERVVWLLGECQSPLIAPANGVGDVAFGSRHDGVLLFVRANLVYLLRNVGTRATSTRGAALALDADATSMPPDRRRPLEISADDEASSTGEQSQDLRVSIQDNSSGCRKFVAPHGAIAIEGPSIVYRGPRHGLQALSVYEWTADSP